jgi:hypothetical protein
VDGGKGDGVIVVPIVCLRAKRVVEEYVIRGARIMLCAKEAVGADDHGHARAFVLFPALDRSQALPSS